MIIDFLRQQWLCESVSVIFTYIACRVFPQSDLQPLRLFSGHRVLVPEIRAAILCRG
jgi:hypothetical protein